MMNLLYRPILALAIVGAAACLAPTASAAIFTPGEAIVNPGLSGTTQYDGWLGLTAGNNPGYPGFPGTAPWPGPIGSNQAGSGDAGLLKIANGIGGAPYPASGSIYYGGFSGDVNNNGGTLAVSDNTPVANLANVVFQIQIGEAWTYDFFNHVQPTLSYNGGAQDIAATGSFVLEKFYNGTVTMPTGDEDVFINTYLLQWDLSGISGPITDFSIQFTGVQHAQLYSLRLDQSDVYIPYGDVVATTPEPSTQALMGMGFAALPLLRRIRKRG